MVQIQDNKALIKFGRGDVRVTSACIDEKGMLSLNTCEVNPIGALTPTQETVDSVLNQSEVLLEFENVSSLEVVILKLQEVRAMMLGIDFSDTLNDNILKYYTPNPFIDNPYIDDEPIFRGTP